jgi:C-terminal processing protease CtpA/Prc
VEQLEPGVGYVNVSSFADPEACRARAELVLQRLSDFPVVIFDVTDGLGGNWGMSGLVLGHLLDSSDQLSAMYWREPQRTQYLQAIVPFEGVDLSAAKVYVLTSSRTFSASEGFAYDLQAAGRATVVGEVTRGGAHAQRLERIDDRFAMALPFARAVNPITQTNWEGTGVRPDIAVPEAEALATVVRLTSASDK